MMDLIKLVEAQDRARLAEANFPNFKAGDTINVHLKITEGSKTRIQQFKGTVIQRRNPGTAGETITVRKVSNGIGVERILPILSPNIEKIELVRQGIVRRARLYYLRGKSGKAARLKEKK
ncbi:MAG: 50S ribosomal protein L19 [Bacteroidetes bacterium]|nr:MAG: 50S ribosomal protein L19 [Bacteroidota bacterium]